MEEFPGVVSDEVLGFPLGYNKIKPRRFDNRRQCGHLPGKDGAKDCRKFAA